MLKKKKKINCKMILKKKKKILIFESDEIET